MHDISNHPLLSGPRRVQATAAPRLTQPASDQLAAAILRQRNQGKETFSVTIGGQQRRFKLL